MAAKFQTNVCITFFTIGLNAGVALAKDIPEAFTVYGLGMVSCGQYISDRTHKPFAEEGYSDWLAGYLSAFNRFNIGANTLTKDLDMAGALGWITNYCRDHPTETLQSATTDLLLFLWKKKSN
ncbi:hypothetical protein [Methyloferula stellata]|uniref:hypothetical protein n=1 Tax=Methyloferula stellata TaxID=876270 RepID=UPI001267A86C|nr:hypothetical protein [Methyloferula stellata]